MAWSRSPRQEVAVTRRRALVAGLMPEHDRDSGSRRVLHVVNCLHSSGWDISFVSHHQNPNPRYVRQFEQRGIEVYAGSPQWRDRLIATRQYDLAVLALWSIAEGYIPRIRELSPQ